MHRPQYGGTRTGSGIAGPRSGGMTLAAAFDPALVELDLGLPLIAFGGISEPEQIASLLQRDNVVAVGIGNFLNYREHAVQAYRSALDALPLRDPIYERPLAIS